MDSYNIQLNARSEKQKKKIQSVLERNFGPFGSKYQSALY